VIGTALLFLDHHTTCGEHEQRLTYPVSPPTPSLPLVCRLVSAVPCCGVQCQPASDRQATLTGRMLAGAYIHTHTHTHTVGLRDWCGRLCLLLRWWLRACTGRSVGRCVHVLSCLLNQLAVVCLYLSLCCRRTHSRARTHACTHIHTTHTLAGWHGMAVY